LHYTVGRVSENTCITAILEYIRKNNPYLSSLVTFLNKCGPAKMFRPAEAMRDTFCRTKWTES
jgi:hypothetical protein